MKFKAIQSDRVHEPTVDPEVTFLSGHDEHYTVAVQGVMECDGTHYEVVAFPVSDGFDNRGMGGFSEGKTGYVVVAFPFNQAYLMSSTNYIMESYIEEKFMRRGSTCDAENIAYLWEKVRIKANIRFGRPEPSNAHPIE